MPAPPRIVSPIINEGERRRCEVPHTFAIDDVVIHGKNNTDIFVAVDTKYRL
jgi:hypothetical protein